MKIDILMDRRLLTGDSKQGQWVFSAAIECFGSLICTALSNASHDDKDKVCIVT